MVSIILPLHFKLKLVTYLLFRKDIISIFRMDTFIHVSMTVTKRDQAPKVCQIPWTRNPLWPLHKISIPAGAMCEVTSCCFLAFSSSFSAR